MRERVEAERVRCIGDGLHTGVEVRHAIGVVLGECEKVVGVRRIGHIAASRVAAYDEVGCSIRGVLREGVEAERVRRIGNGRDTRVEVGHAVGVVLGECEKVVGVRRIGHVTAARVATHDEVSRSVGRVLSQRVEAVRVGCVRHIASPGVPTHNEVRRSIGGVLREGVKPVGIGRVGHVGCAGGQARVEVGHAVGVVLSLRIKLWSDAHGLVRGEICAGDVGGRPAIMPRQPGREVGQSHTPREGIGARQSPRERNGQAVTAGHSVVHPEDSRGFDSGVRCHACANRHTAELSHWIQSHTSNGQRADDRRESTGAKLIRADIHMRTDPAGKTRPALVSGQGVGHRIIARINGRTASEQRDCGGCSAIGDERTEQWIERKKTVAGEIAANAKAGAVVRGPNEVVAAGGKDARRVRVAGCSHQERSSVASNDGIEQRAIRPRSRVENAAPLGHAVGGASRSVRAGQTLTDGE